MTPAERPDLYVREGRIIRYEWTGRDNQGRATACLLAALAGDIKSPEECPASVLWPWLAHMVPLFDDCASTEAWSAMVRRFAAVMHGYPSISADPAAERRVLAGTMLAALEIAAPLDLGSACAAEAALWRRALAGDEPTWAEWKSARAKARRQAPAGEALALAAASSAAAMVAWDIITDACLSAIETEIENAAPMPDDG